MWTPGVEHPTRAGPPLPRAPTIPARGPGAQLVARIETQLRLRDGWMAEIEAVRSNELLDQARARIRK